MRTFAQKPKTNQPTTCAKSSILSRAYFRQGRDPHSILNLQHTIGNQAVQRLLHTDIEGSKADSGSAARPRFIHDFSRVSVLHRPTTLNEGVEEGLGAVSQAQEAGNQPTQETAIPIVGAEEEEVEMPDLSITPSPLQETELPGAADSCSQPMSMTKVTAGAFQGGLSMGDYYPDLVGRGYWQAGGTAGSWNTGTRAGVNVQLFGTVPSPCRPEQFTLEQHVTRRVHRVNGVATAREGTSADDIAASGRDASRAPFRQEWLGGGLNISMADPPSSTYGASTNKEYIKDFETSLVGPGGRRTVNWTISLKIENGGVVRNSVS
jgi:hypothetical protein